MRAEYIEETAGVEEGVRRRKLVAAVEGLGWSCRRGIGWRRWILARAAEDTKECVTVLVRFGFSLRLGSGLRLGLGLGLGLGI